MDSKPSPSSGRYENSKKPYLSKSVSDANSHSQSLASILNNPHAGKSDGWWWPSNFSSLPVVPEFTPLNPLPKPGSDITRTDFFPYITSFSDPFCRFHDIQQHSKSSLLDDQNGENALVACLREVPALYFKEDFHLEDGATFKAACPFRTTPENLVMQEKLSQYLDVVELHLVREISLRSSSFFEAQGQLEDLNSKIVEGCKRIRELKETIRLLDTNLVGPARELQDLNVKRSDLVALQNKLKLIIYVNQALSTLNLVEEFKGAIHRLRKGRETGPNKISVDFLKSTGEAGMEWLTRLLSYTMKVWKRMVELRLRRIVTCFANQFGFMPSRSTIETIHLVRRVALGIVSWPNFIWLGDGCFDAAYSRGDALVYNEIENLKIWGTGGRSGGDEREIITLQQFVHGKREVGANLLLRLFQHSGRGHGVLQRPLWKRLRKSLDFVKEKRLWLVASADCAGALDVTDDLQHLLDGDELAGLHCFRHLRDELATSIDSINSILSAEFMRITIQETGNMDATITSKFKARATIAINGESHEVKLDEETSNFRDRLLPFVIGLLRTGTYDNDTTARLKDGVSVRRVVEEMWFSQGWNLVFRRHLNDWEIVDVVELLKVIGGGPGANLESDRLKWGHHEDGSFSVNSITNVEGNLEESGPFLLALPTLIGSCQNTQQICEAAGLGGEAVRVRRNGGDQSQLAFGGPFGNKEIRESLKGKNAKLPTLLRIYRDTLTADMKTAIKTAVEELLRVLVAQPLDSDFVAGERVVDTDGGSSSLASRLRSLPPENFVQLLKAIFMIVQAHLVQASEVKKTIEWIICHLDDHYAADSVAAAIALGAAAAETVSESDCQSTTFSQFSPSSNFSRAFTIQEKGNDATTMSNLSRNFRHIFRGNFWRAPSGLPAPFSGGLTPSETSFLTFSLRQSIITLCDYCFNPWNPFTAAPWQKTEFPLMLGSNISTLSDGVRVVTTDIIG
ncbi:Vacuolar protein sorting-associated protein 54, chloroplastic [Capsicum annuum]|nr:Vacuolar protein sorting-associated protein 54, chloroplastic [Capsicum annuum]